MSNKLTRKTETKRTIVWKFVRNLGDDAEYILNKQTSKLWKCNVRGWSTLTKKRAVRTKTREMQYMIIHPTDDHKKRHYEAGNLLPDSQYNYDLMINGLHSQLNSQHKWWWWARIYSSLPSRLKWHVLRHFPTNDVGRQLGGYSLKHTTIGNKITPMKVFGME